MIELFYKKLKRAKYFSFEAKYPNQYFHCPKGKLHISSDKNKIITQESGHHRSEDKAGYTFFNNKYQWLFNFKKITIELSHARYSKQPTFLLNLNFCPGNILCMEGMHLCGEDTYQAKLFLNTNNNLQLTWFIRGPNKTIQLNSIYYLSY